MASCCDSLKFTLSRRNNVEKHHHKTALKPKIAEKKPESHHTLTRSEEVKGGRDSHMKKPSMPRKHKGK